VSIANKKNPVQKPAKNRQNKSISAKAHLERGLHKTRGENEADPKQKSVNELN
jgi:hypothetical protein